MPTTLHTDDLRALVRALARNDLSEVASTAELLADDVDEMTRSFAVLCVHARRVNDGGPSSAAPRPAIGAGRLPSRRGSLRRPAPLAAATLTGRGCARPPR